MTNPLSELLPCPFCGSCATLLKKENELNIHGVDLACCDQCAIMLIVPIWQSRAVAVPDTGKKIDKENPQTEVKDMDTDNKSNQNDRQISDRQAAFTELENGAWHGSAKGYWSIRSALSVPSPQEGWPDTKNLRWLMATATPEVGTPKEFFDAMIDLTKICDLIEAAAPKEKV